LIEFVFIPHLWCLDASSCVLRPVQYVDLTAPVQDFTRAHTLTHTQC